MWFLFLYPAKITTRERQENQDQWCGPVLDRDPAWERVPDSLRQYSEVM
jgi:hypothetical protein